MLDGRKIVGIIAARGGSKGFPGKHLALLGNRSILSWTIEAAKGSTLLDRVVLSSDDPQIIAEAKRCGCEVPFVRPPEMATDEAPIVDVIIHALKQLPGFDYVVLLQGSSPLRTAGDIDDAIRTCIGTGSRACVTLTEGEKSPTWMYRIKEDGRLKPLIRNMEDRHRRRQDLEAVYVLNGAVYIAEISWFEKKRSFLTHQTIGHCMPRERSVDIDTLADLKLAEFFSEQR